MHPIDAFAPPAAAVIGGVLLVALALLSLREWVSRRRRRAPSLRPTCSALGCGEPATHDARMRTTWVPRCEPHAQWLPYDRVRER